MDHTPAGIESELLDLSMFGVETLRSISDAGVDATIDRVRMRILDSQGTISGYNGSFSDHMRPTDSQSEDRGR